MQAHHRQNSPGRRERKSAQATLIQAPLPVSSILWRKGATESMEGRAGATFSIVAKRASVSYTMGPGKMLSEGESDSSIVGMCSVQGSEPELQDTSI